MAYAVQLQAKGLPLTLLEELQARLTEFEAQRTRVAAARRHHITASTLLDATTMEFAQIIQLLGFHYRFTYRTDTAMLAA